MPKSKTKSSRKLKSKPDKSSSFDVTRIKHHHLYSFLVFSFGVILFFQTLSISVNAQSYTGNLTIPNPSRYNSLEDIINALAGLIRPVFILTFAAMVLYGAYMWITSQGDADKIKTARGIIIAAIVGFIIAVFAPTIVQFVGSLLGVNTLRLS